MQDFLHAFVFFMLAVEYVSAQANHAQKDDSQVNRLFVLSDCFMFFNYSQVVKLRIFWSLYWKSDFQVFAHIRKIFF